VDIVRKIDYDFETNTKNLHDITLFEWIARSIHIDRIIKEFLNEYPNTTIVNIGCGLDTTFDRVDNGKLLRYDLDLPDAIEFRRKFIQESERRKFISRSFLDESWFSEIKNKEHVWCTPFLGQLLA
jgi:O-methyltransferase involved in polyketide biosynthesis